TQNTQKKSIHIYKHHVQHYRLNIQGHLRPKSIIIPFPLQALVLFCVCVFVCVCVCVCVFLLTGVASAHLGCVFHELPKSAGSTSICWLLLSRSLFCTPSKLPQSPPTLPSSHTL